MTIHYYEEVHNGDYEQYGFAAWTGGSECTGELPMTAGDDQPELISLSSITEYMKQSPGLWGK